ncbi:MAG: N-acetylneuraminate synthase family protein, partial [Candidatus Hodarchaeota archaeon]
MEPFIEIKGRRVGSGYPTYIVAEMSANHNQSYEKARKLVRAAKTAGADAIKLQTYTPDTLTIDCTTDPFRIPSGNTWGGQTLYELYSKAYTPWEWQPKLKQLADELGLDCFSTPFDHTAVDFLAEMNVPAYKVASFE